MRLEVHVLDKLPCTVNLWNKRKLTVADKNLKLLIEKLDLPINFRN